MQTRNRENRRASISKTPKQASANKEVVEKLTPKETDSFYATVELDRARALDPFSPNSPHLSYSPGFFQELDRLVQQFKNKKREETEFNYLLEEAEGTVKRLDITYKVSDPSPSLIPFFVALLMSIFSV